MLKWTVTQQHRLSESTSTENVALRTPRMSPSKRRRRRATIANKENIITSTPMAPQVQQRHRLSPLVLAPLADILNITPEPVSRTPERVLPQQYASTLPKFEEEYSPSTLVPGRVLAMRGLLPDTYLGNPRYFTTPEVTARPPMEAATPKALPKKRKLDMEMESTPLPSKIDRTSTEMGDQTLDKLIDAILESACKDKKKKPRKSFNLRRRALMKTTEESVDNLVLSPSYARADDPASDLSFMRVEAVDDVIECEKTYESPVKKIKIEDDCGKYFEIGLALPSIYV